MTFALYGNKEAFWLSPNATLSLGSDIMKESTGYIRAALSGAALCVALVLLALPVASIIQRIGGAL